MSFRDDTYKPLTFAWFVWGTFWLIYYYFAIFSLSEIANMSFCWMAAKVTAACLGVFFVILELAYRGAIKQSGHWFQLRLSSMFLWTIVVALCLSVLRSIINPEPRLSTSRPIFDGPSGTLFGLGFSSVIVFGFTLWLGHSLLWLAIRIVRTSTVQRFLQKKH